MNIRLPNGSGRDQVLIASAYLYLAIPIVIFLFGWMRWPLAAVSAGALLIGTLLTLKDFGYVEDFGSISCRFLVVAFLICVVWVALSGVGGFGYQNIDFSGRNAVFRDLINHPWPVSYDYSGNIPIREILGNTGGLVYYFAYWLPSALVGKLFGLPMANFALFVWTLVGAYLCILLVVRYVGKAHLLIVLAFVLWSGLDIIGQIIVAWPGLVSGASVGQFLAKRRFLAEILALFYNTDHMEFWAGAGVWQYSSFTVQLYWVFNQSIPAWITTLLLLSQTGKKSLLFTYVLVLYFAPLPAIGLLPYLIYKFAGRGGNRTRAPGDSSNSLRQLYGAAFSAQNTVIALALGLIIVLFYVGKTATLHGFIWEFIPLTGDSASGLSYA